MKRRLGGAASPSASAPKARRDGSATRVAMTVQLQIPKVDIERPCPKPAYRADPPLAPGASYLSQLFERFLGRCEAAERADLASWVVNELHGQIRVGSICSGTDVPVLVWRAFAVALQCELHVELEVVHLFSAEQDKGKRQFLEVMFPENKLMFGDARELGGSSARDCLSGEDQPVPDDIDTGAAGWPCTDVSKANNGAKDNRTCVVDGTKSTGEVFRGVRKLISNHGANMRFFLNENVRALAKAPGDSTITDDNLSAAVWLLRQECDCWTKVWSLCPTDLGVPQCRERLWFPCFPLARLSQLGLSETEANDTLSGIMSRLVGSQPIDVENYLLAAGSELYEHFRSKAMSRRRARDDALAKWPKMHMDLFEKRGLDWSIPSYPCPDTIAKYPLLASVHNRDFDILQLHNVTYVP